MIVGHPLKRVAGPSLHFKELACHSNKMTLWDESIIPPSRLHGRWSAILEKVIQQK